MGSGRGLAAGAAIFFISQAISGTIYFSRRPVHFADALFSNFMSPGENPHGYWPAAAGTALAGLALTPSALLFYRRFQPIHKFGARAAAFFYLLGLAAAVLIGSTAPFPILDYSIHVFLAYGAFISLQAAISVYLTVAMYGALKAQRSDARALVAFASVEWTASAILISIAFFTDWAVFGEWSLCVTIASGLWVLNRHAARLD